VINVLELRATGGAAARVGARSSPRQGGFATSLGGTMVEGLFQPMHLLLILIIALVVFGPKRLPELGKTLGEGIRGFRKAMSEDTSSRDDSTIN
jgi:sec-independent protein translocase protein TatA